MIALPYSTAEGYQPGDPLPGHYGNGDYQPAFRFTRLPSRAQMILRTLMDEMAKRSRPTLLRILRDEKAKGGDEARTCVCGGTSCLKRMSIEEACSKYPDPKFFGWSCDGCGEKQCEIDRENKNVVHRNRDGAVTHIWQCDRKSSAHLSGITVCDRCIRNPPTDLEFPGE